VNASNPALTTNSTPMESNMDNASGDTSYPHSPSSKEDDVIKDTNKQEKGKDKEEEGGTENASDPPLANTITTMESNMDNASEENSSPLNLSSKEGVSLPCSQKKQRKSLI